jgi:tetratricopeptide (TPR) repeat protein
MLPVLLLALIEIALRIFGYGYPSTFFVKTQINGKAVFVENQKFGFRFFPLTAVRSPPATVMPAEKGRNTYRIFVFGESAALGDPEQAYGFWRCLKVLLEERFPGADFEVICAAMTGVNSHVILPIARECARHDGDLWIIYMGNNEIIGPYGPSNPVPSRAQNLQTIRAIIAARATRTGQLLDAARQRFSSRPKSPKQWEGMAMFSEHELQPDDPGRERAYRHFEANLDDILRAAERAGVKTIVSTVASNLRNCAPFSSLHPKTLKDSDRTTWENIYSEAIALEIATNTPAAAAKYIEASRIEGAYAELHFRLAHCHLAMTNNLEAASSFERARDLDALCFRTTSKFNKAIANSIGPQFKRSVLFLDGARVLSQVSPHGVPGSELFYDQVHLRFEGNYLLARAMADQVLTLLPQSITTGRRHDWIKPDACAERLGLTEWNRYHSADSMLQRIGVPPFTKQLDHEMQVEALLRELSYLRTRMTPETALRARQTFEAILSSKPNDYLVRRKYAEFLSETGNFNEQLDQWQRIRALVPHHPVAYFRLGQLLSESGRYAEAETQLREALRIRSDHADASVELGRTLAQQGKHDEAVACYKEALKFQPTSASAHYHLANSFLAQSRTSDALKSLNESVRLRPAFWEARYLLGLELARSGKDADAATQFAEVIKLRPEHATAHLNLGVALHKQGRSAEALKHFRETLRLEPSNAVARKYATQGE